MRIKQIILATSITASLGILVFSAGPVFARESDSESVNSNSQITQSTNKAEEKKLEAQKKLEEAKREAQKKIDEAKLEAQKKLDETKQNVKSKTEAERQKYCQEKSAQIAQRITKKTADANKHLATFDKIYNRVKDFKTKNNLNVANYDNLVANVDSSAKNAQAAIDALKSIDPKVDCTTLDAAKTKIATYVAAIKQAREALKSYRTAIKDLSVAVKNSAIETLKTEAEPTPTPTVNNGGSN